MTTPGHSWKCLQGKCGRQCPLQAGKTKTLNTLDRSSSPLGEIGQSRPGHLTGQLLLLAYFRMWWNQSFLGDQIHYLGPGVEFTSYMKSKEKSCQLWPLQHTLLLFLNPHKFCLWVNHIGLDYRVRKNSTSPVGALTSQNLGENGRFQGGKR